LQVNVYECYAPLLTQRLNFANNYFLGLTVTATLLRDSATTIRVIRVEFVFMITSG
jgi:hypothetical protein